MSGRALLATVAALALACAPAVAVRPGSSAAPTRISVRVRADAVALVGSMTEWRPMALRREGDAWELAVDLPPGRYEYRLEVREGADSRVVLPEGAEKVDDGFGGANAVLRVP